MFERYTRIIIRLRYVLLPAWMLLVGLSVSQFPKLRFDTSIHPLLEASQEQRLAVKDFRRALPPLAANFICAVEWPREVGQNELDALASFEDCAREHDASGRVLSLGSISVCRAVDGLPTQCLFREDGTDDSALQRVRRHPLLARWLLSKDGRAAVVLIHLKKRESVASLRAHLEGHAPPGSTLRFFAGHLVAETIRETMLGDMKRGLIAEVVLVALATILLFRTARGVLVSMAAPLSALFFFLALTTRLGAISIIEIAVPGLILVIGLCDAIHIVCAFEEAIGETATRHDAVILAMERVGHACFWTSATTAIGFLSLLTTEHAAVRELAKVAGIGVGIAFLTVVTVVPLLLCLWPVRHAAPAAGWLHAVTQALRSRRAYVAGLALLGLSLLGLPRLVIDSRWLEELPADREIVQTMRWYENRISGLLSIEMHVTGHLGEPATIRALTKLEERVCRQPDVTRVESYTLWVRELVGNDNTPVTDEDLALGGEILQHLKPELFPRHLVTPELNEARIVFSARDMSTQKYLDLKRVLEELTVGLPAGVTAEVAGYGRMAHESSRLIVTTILRGFVLTLAAVCLLIGLTFRSWRLCLIAVLPNAIPIVCALGLTGWLGINLRVGVVMVFCVGVGLAVDDTIHLLTRFVDESRQHGELSVQERVANALRSTGSALFVTSAVLFLAVLCHLPADFRSLRDTGIILATIVAVAYIADVVLLPHLLIRFLRDTTWGKGKHRSVERRRGKPEHSPTGPPLSAHGREQQCSHRQEP